MVIDSTLEPGHLTYAELLIEGEGEGEVLVSTYVCHPSLANDNLSGIAVATMLAKRLLRAAPAPLLPLPVRARDDRPARLARPATATGSTGSSTGSRSPASATPAASPTSAAAAATPRSTGRWRSCCATRAPRTGCSLGSRGAATSASSARPGFDLPVGTLMRTPHGEFDGYHTSADGLERIRPESLAEAVETCLALVDVLESNRRCTNLSPYGEPQLGRRGLYRSAGGAVATPDDERALLWVLNQQRWRAPRLLEIARDSGLAYPVVQRAAERLERAGLLAEDHRTDPVPRP